MVDVEFYPEYFATSVWIKSRGTFVPIGEYNKLPLSEHLIKELQKFDDTVMDVIDWSGSGGESPMSFEERMDLYELAKNLCKRVQDELGGDYNVIDCTDWLKPK